MSLLKNVLLFLFIFLFNIQICLCQERVLEIGAILPLSGNLAHIGSDAELGMLLAQKELADKNIQVDIIFEDDGYMQDDSRFCLQNFLSLPCKGDFYAVKLRRN